MITIRNLNFAMEGKPLFEGASASIPPRTTVGVVGRNGCGKTTLFRLIRGELALDGGDIDIPRQARIGGVAQEAPASDQTLLETVLAADLERADLLKRAETEMDPNEIAEIQTRLVDIDAHSAEARAASILQGLGFDTDAQNRACSEFSGGWRMRVALASVLFSAPDLLLLDEPTNYLDLEGTIWLENYLARYPHTCLIISHDRGLLNRAVKGILHLSDGNLTYYKGGYDSFDAMRQARLEQQVAAKRKQDLQRAHIQSFVDRFRAQASKARQAQSRLKMLEKMKPLAALSENAVAGFQFRTPEELPPPLIAVSGGAVGYDGPPILSKLNFRLDQDDRIALLGANGQGKSTLSKLLADRLELMDGTGTRSRKLRIGYFAQHQLDELREDETPIQHIASRFPDETPAKHRARLGVAGFGSDTADVEARRLSGGQRARLLLMLATLDAPHLLILDEPTNHLDIESREALIHALNDYGGAVILVSHDAHLVEMVADRFWLVHDGQVKPYDGDMANYKKFLLSQRGGSAPGPTDPAKIAKAAKKAQAKAARAAKSAPKPATPDPAPAKPRSAPARLSPANLREAAAKGEARVTALQGMLARIDERLNEVALGDTVSPAELEKLGIKRGEIVDGLARAEEMWMAALEQMDTAG